MEDHKYVHINYKYSLIKFLQRNVKVLKLKVKKSVKNCGKYVIVLNLDREKNVSQGEILLFSLEKYDRDRRKKGSERDEGRV